MKSEGKDRRSSKVWQVFTRLDGEGTARCDICGSILSYKSSTTNLAKHLDRKHRTVAFRTLGENGSDARTELKEFISLDSENVESEEVVAVENLREEDSEWQPPKKMPRKPLPMAQQKKIKPEVITSNGVDYLIYTHDEAANRANPISARPTVSSSSARSTPAMPRPDDDEFSCFARFLAKRIRSLKDPYWQSCALNEINSALHKVEMRRYEPPRVSLGNDLSVQTEPIDPLEITGPMEELVEEIS